MRIHISFHFNLSDEDEAFTRVLQVKNLDQASSHIRYLNEKDVMEFTC